MDHVPKQKRSLIMSLVKGANTKPEVTVRAILHRLGFRFRLHDRNLPGKPDIVLRKWKAVILVHGCFWHRHPGCEKAGTPKTRIKFWQAKFAANVKRDRHVVRRLKELGWRVCLVWQCETKTPDLLGVRLEKFIKGNRAQPKGTVANAINSRLH